MQKRSRREAGSWSADEVFLQPWFLDHEHAAAVRSVVPDHFVHKMRFYFEDWAVSSADHERGGTARTGCATSALPEF